MFATIAARTEFLPTDLILEPSTSWVYNNALYIFFPAFILMIANILLLAGKGSEGFPDISRFITAPLAVIFVTLFVGTALHIQTTSADRRDAGYELKEQSRDNFISNIESVYDAEVVKLDTSYISPANKVELIVSQDGVAYEVIATQDPDTYEPSLMVIASPTSDITEIRKK